MATVAEYGSWKSDLTPDVFSQGNCGRVGELNVFRDSIFWIEQNRETGKRELYQQKQGQTRIRWADGFSVQNAVHEYGGGSYAALSDGAVVFSTVDGVFRQKSHSDAPQKITGSKSVRYADFGVSPKGDYALAVQETHPEGKKNPDNRIVRIRFEDSFVQVISEGCDFYAQPRVSPDGTRMSWMQWDLPHMPWDETEVIVESVSDGAGDSLKISGCNKGINYYNPTWRDDRLFLVSDKTNFWNIYQVGLDDGSLTNVFPIKEEIGFPLWQFGDRQFAVNDRLIVFAAGGSLYVKEGDKVRRVPAEGYNTFSFVSLSDSDVIFTIASGPIRPASIISIDLKHNDALTVIRATRKQEDIEKFDISLPEKVPFVSDGVELFGYFYPPKNSKYVGPPDSLPPVILMGHPGPTLPCSAVLDMKKQFFTTRGFAVFDVNYRGSSGCGTDFRNRLNDMWGVADRDDFIAAARTLINNRFVDPRKICLVGSSASGFTLLACIIDAPEMFAAAVSLYGVADLFGLVQDTHKFELGYNSTLLGTLPYAEEEYRKRSPILHVDEITRPVAFIHGKEDTVVPVSQSIEMFQQLKKNGVTTALLLFDDEGHGFRGAKAVREANEATYFFLCKAIGVQPSLESSIVIENLESQ